MPNEIIFLQGFFMGTLFGIFIVVLLILGLLVGT